MSDPTPSPLFPDLTGVLDAAPRDPSGVAFFDLDRTLVDGYSIVAFLHEALRAGLVAPGRILEQARAVLEEGRGGLGALIERFVGTLSGERDATLEAIGARAFRRQVAGRIHPEARALIRAHRERGHRVVILSSATRYQVEPVARALGIPLRDVLCTRLVVDEAGRLTGRWKLPGCWNEGKRLHARAWLRRNGGRFENAWFYTDSHEDVALLERVGHPVVVNPDGALARRAAAEDWPVLRFRRRRPGVESVVRTGLTLSSVYGSLAAGAATLALGGRWRDAVDVSLSTFGHLGLAVGGVRLRVTGEHHLLGARPAVVVFNHQSALDGLIMARLLRGEFSGVCKRELAWNPVFGPALRAAGMIFVDRDSARGGARALGPALEALRGGRSLAIAPEGTRSVSTRPGAFHRGAFYLARRARVPIVPVVIHNSGDVLPRGGLLLRGDVPVQVTVLPPLQASHWHAGDLARHADALHQRYLRLLGFEGGEPATEADGAPAAQAEVYDWPETMPIAV